MAKIKIAACQMQMSADIAANLKRITDAIRRAAQMGADLVVFPECAVSGYPPLHHSSPQEIGIDAIADANSRVCAVAAESGIWTVVGTILPGGARLRNVALLIDPAGRTVGIQDKIHLFPGDERFFAAGDDVTCFDIKGVRIGLQVCYDVRFPEISRVQRELGAQVFAVILNACGDEFWKLPVLEGTFRCRAAENTAYMVAVNAAGPGQTCVSRICDPLGVDLAAATRDTEQILIADIDTDQTLQGYYNDRRTDLFRVEQKNNCR